MQKKLTGIAATDEDFLLGFNSAQNYRMPWGRQMQDDLAFFRKTTAGCPVVMGHKTAQSIGHLLPGRLNLVFSRQAEVRLGEYVLRPMCQSAGRLLQSWAQLPELLAGCRQTAFLIGGADLFAQALQQGYLDNFYFTHINARLAGEARTGEKPIYLPSNLRAMLQGALQDAMSLPIQELEQGSRNLYAAQIYHIRLGKSR